MTSTTMACEDLAREALEPGTRWRHKKRGHTYEVVGVGRMQADDWFTSHRQFEGVNSVDMEEAVIYRDRADGPIWVRPVSEFLDGRFEPLPRTAYDAIGSGVKTNWIANCVRCGRVVDTREEKDGGDKFGCELSRGGWTCSFECWEAEADPAPTHTAAGAGLVGEVVAWQIGANGAVYRTEAEAWVHVNGWRTAEIAGSYTCPDPRPLYARTVEDPGEVERLRAEAHNAHLAVKEERALAETAEAALAKTRERLEKVEAELRYAAMGLDRIHNSLMTNWPKQASGEMTAHFLEHARAALTGDAQEAGR